jgi:DNA-binding CsgD family transcriptional regulator
MAQASDLTIAPAQSPSAFAAQATTRDSLSGRSPELSTLAALLERQDGAALVLVGEAGVGKTALLRAAVDQASHAGMRILSASGVQFETDVTFSTLHQVLDPVRDRFDRLSPTHRQALDIALGLSDGSVPRQLVVSNAALGLLRDAAADSPVLIVVDDLPWIDRASAIAIGFVARRIAGTRLAFLAAARSDEEQVLIESGLPRLEVRPLDEDAAATLVNAHFPDLDRRLRQVLLDTARGNPLALLEFGSALSERRIHTSRFLSAVTPQGRQLHALFAAQIGQLSDKARWTLLLLALDASGDLQALSRIGPPQEFSDGLAAVRDARLVSVDPDAMRVEFRHPLIRSAVVELTPEEERRHAHAALAALFVDDPDRQARHLAEAAPEPDEQVADQLAATARRRLRRGDAVGAVAALTRAARLSPLAADRGRRLAQAAYIGADLTGNLVNVASLLADAGTSDQGNSLETASAAAFSLLIGDGDIETAHALLVGAIDHRRATSHDVDSALEEALHTLYRVCYFGGRAELWEPLERTLDSLGPNAPLSVVMRTKTQGNPIETAADVLPPLDAAIKHLANETDPAWVIRIATAASFIDRLYGCRAPLWRLVRDGRAGGAVTAALSGLILLGIDDYWTGQWDEAVELSEEAVDLCEQLGYSLYTPSAQHVLALVSAARGDYGRAQALTNLMLAWAAPRRMRSVQQAAAHARGLAALTRGDFEEAFREATKITPAAVLESHNPYVLWSALDIVEAAVRSGRQSEATSHARALRDVDIGAISPRLRLVERGCAAMVAPDSTTAALFQEALATPGIDRWPFDTARIQLAFGERLRRLRRIRESRIHLNSAAEMFDRLGAAPWASRVRDELRASGQGSRRARGANAESLTAQERGIAELAAAGLTNKEIGQRLYLSHRTVSGHLHRVFPKLGVTSRAALRDALDSIEKTWVSDPKTR